MLETKADEFQHTNSFVLTKKNSFTVSGVVIFPFILSLYQLINYTLQDLGDYDNIAVKTIMMKLKK